MKKIRFMYKENDVVLINIYIRDGFVCLTGKTGVFFTKALPFHVSSWPGLSKQDVIKKKL